MLKELKSQHRNIIQMSFNGYKNNEIAERLGMSPTTVSTILRSPLGQAYLNGLQDKSQEATLDVRKKLVSLNKSALNTFERLLNPKEKAPPGVQFGVAKDILDRNGYKPPDRFSIDMTLQTKTDEELDAEILAIQEVLARNNLTNPPSLPEKSDLKELTSPITDNSSSFSSQLSDVDTFELTSNADAKLEHVETDDQTSLEDFFPNETFELEALPELEESPSFEDPDLLENPSFNPFHNLKS